MGQPRARLEQLLHQLDGDDVAAQAEALSLLRRGRAVKHISDVMRFLDENQPRELRLEAVRAVYDAPNPDSWKTYTGFLDDPDMMIRSYVAELLGNIGNKDAGDALFAVTDPERFPRSYTAAFGALVKLKDPRADEVAARLEQSAPDEWVRDMARAVLRSSENK